MNATAVGPPILPADDPNPGALTPRGQGASPGDSALLDAYSSAVVSAVERVSAVGCPHRGPPRRTTRDAGAAAARGSCSPRRLHPDQQPRRHGAAGVDVTLHDGRRHPRRARSATTRTPTWRWSASAPTGLTAGRAGRLAALRVGAARHRDRQPLRLPVHGHGRRRQRAGRIAALAVGAADRRRDPDRRGAEPGQLGRAAGRLARRGDRREHGDDPAGAGDLLRHRDQHREVRRRPPDPRRPGPPQPHRRGRADGAPAARGARASTPAAASLILGVEPGGPADRAGLARRGRDPRPRRPAVAGIDDLHRLLTDGARRREHAHRRLARRPGTGAGRDAARVGVSRRRTVDSIRVRA